MATIQGGVTPGFSFTQTGSTGFLTGTQIPLQLTLALNIAAGTAADKADLIHALTYTFVASTAQTIDLTSLTDVLGGAVNFARVRLFALRVNSTTDAASLTIGNAAATQWLGFLGTTTSTLIIPAASAANTTGAWTMITGPNTTGMAVSGSSKSLKMLPSAHAFTADLIIVGCSA